MWPHAAHAPNPETPTPRPLGRFAPFAAFTQGFAPRPETRLIKRLEADRFKWPKESDLVELSVEQLHWLLEGINLSAMQPHPARNYQRVG